MQLLTLLNIATVFGVEASAVSTNLEFDFVVGGGTAGLALAARLSETNASVAVLEAGGPPIAVPSTSVPGEFHAALSE